MSDLKITKTDTDGDLVVLDVVDEHGNPHQIKLNSIDAMSLLSGVNIQLAELARNPEFRGWGLPNTERIQIVETPETVYLRVFLGHGLYHEYPVAQGTTLAEGVRRMGAYEEQRLAAKLANQPPGSPSNKN